jgi:hypothetical protein
MCPNRPPIQNEVNFAFPKTLHVYPTCKASRSTLLHIPQSSNAFDPFVIVIALDASRSTRTEQGNYVTESLLHSKLTNLL